MSFTIFYAWQADLDQKINRYFIRDATLRAIAKLSADATVNDAPQLDHDTRGVSGTPDIFQVILEKIDACGLFLADVTPVTKYSTASNETKQAPNSNVMLELGYALARVGDRRILTVFNRAFGSPSEAPFDWSRRRWPLSWRI
jgi:predicted nucleotide-binding protein